MEKEPTFFTEWLQKRPYLLRFSFHLIGSHFFISVVLTIKILILYLLGMEFSAKCFAEIGYPCAFIAAILHTMNQKI